MTSIYKRHDIISPNILPIYQRTLIVNGKKYTPKRRDIISPNILPIYQRTLIVNGKKYTPKRHSFIHNNGLFICEYCKYTTKKGNTLSMHIRSHHHIEAGWNVCNHVCNQCNYKTPLKSKLNQHISRHHIKKMEQCPFCFKDFKLNDVFAHIYIHTTPDIKNKNQGLSKYKLGKLMYNSAKSHPWGSGRPGAGHSPAPSTLRSRRVSRTAEAFGKRTVCNPTSKGGGPKKQKQQVVEEEEEQKVVEEEEQTVVEEEEQTVVEEEDSGEEAEVEEKEWEGKIFHVDMETKIIYNIEDGTNIGSWDEDNGPNLD